MKKTVLKKIAKEWACGILKSTGEDSFFDLENSIDYEDAAYIVQEVHKIGQSIIKNMDDNSIKSDLESIIKKHAQPK
jgi:hypothetical protein